MLTDHRRAVVSHPSQLIGRGRLGDNLEQPILFSWRARQKQPLECRAWRKILPSLLTGGLVLFPKARDLRHKHFFGAFLLYPIIAAFGFGRPTEDCLGKRQFKVTLRPAHQDRYFLTGLYRDVLLNDSIAHFELKQLYRALNAAAIKSNVTASGKLV